MQTEVQFTYDDYKTLPESGPRYQLISGELLMTPAPNTKHQRISRNLEFILFQYARSTSNGEVFNAPFDVILSETDVVQPDLVYILNEKRHCIKSEGLRGAPGLVVEILSSSTTKIDRGVKLKLYAKYGVEELWIIDPELETIEVFELQKNLRKPKRVIESHQVLTSNLLPEFSCSLQDVFPSEK